MLGFISLSSLFMHVCPWVQTCVPVSVYDLPVCALTPPHLLDALYSPDQPALCFLLIAHLSLFLSHCSTPCPRPLPSTYLSGEPPFPFSGQRP